jgi:hypothetical protein
MGILEDVARAIWSVRREEEDRCDMELEDIGEDHSVWAEAQAAIEVQRRYATEIAIIEIAARAMCESWHYAKIGTPDGDAEWRAKQGQYRTQAEAALCAAFIGGEPS